MFGRFGTKATFFRDLIYSHIDGGDGGIGGGGGGCGGIGGGDGGGVDGSGDGDALALGVSDHASPLMSIP